MEKLLTDKEIIEQLMPAIKENPNSFAKKLGYKSPASIYNITRGDSNLTTSMAHTIVEVFPEVNFLFVTMGQLPIKVDPGKAIGQGHIMGFGAPKLEDLPKLLSDMLSVLKEINEKLDN